MYLNDEKGSTAATQVRQMLRTIENALANWARNQQKCGLSPTDAMIQEKVLWFAENCGNAGAKNNVTSTEWLNTFKRRHLNAAEPSMDVLDTNRSDSTGEAYSGISLISGPTVCVPIVLCPSFLLDSHTFSC